MERTNADIDLTGNPSAGPDETDALRRRVAELEVELATARAEAGRLQLQLDLFTATDPVTGLVNRTGTLDAVETALDRLSRMAEGFAVVLISVPELMDLSEPDPDATRHIGALIAGGLRRLDRVGRLEDGTFATVLTNIGADYIELVTGRVRSALTAAPVELNGEPVQLQPHMVTIVASSSTDRDSHQIVELGCDLLASTGETGTLHFL